jgi:protein TonB
LDRSGSLVVALLAHTALLLWLLSANLAGDPVHQEAAPIAVELVKLPPSPPPQEPPQKPESRQPPEQKRPMRAVPLPPIEAGPPVHEISANDDEWVAPRVNENKEFSNGGGRAPSDYAEKVKEQVIAKMEYPPDALYKPPRYYRGDLNAYRQQCRIAYEITVDRSGNRVSYKFERCGIAKLDAAADAALSKSGPFPPPPDLGAETYVIYGVQIFRLK